MLDNKKNSRKNIVGRNLSLWQHGLMGLFLFCVLLTSAANAGTEGCCGVDSVSSGKAISATQIPSSSKSRKVVLLA